MPESDTASGGNFLTKKMFGLPTWGWVGIAAAAGVVGFTWWKSHKAATAAATTTPTTTADTSLNQGLATEQYESILALLRDIQGQNSTSTNTPDPSVPVPTGLVAVPKSKEIDLTWDTVPGAIGYQFNVSSDAGYTSTSFRPALPGDKQTWNDVGQNFIGKHTFSVAAVMPPAKIGAFSAPVTATPLP